VGEHVETVVASTSLPWRQQSAAVFGDFTPVV
jgi:hypothetical protein